MGRCPAFHKADTRCNPRQMHSGCDCCDGCGIIGHLYEPLPTCSDCRDQFCKDCRVTSQDSEDERNETLCLTCAVLEAIHLASDPKCGPMVYRPARRAAYQLTRTLVRRAIASEWREKLIASAALTHGGVPTADDYRANRDGRGGMFTGD